MSRPLRLPSGAVRISDAVPYGNDWLRFDVRLPQHIGEYLWTSGDYVVENGAKTASNRLESR